MTKSNTTRKSAESKTSLTYLSELCAEENARIERAAANGLTWAKIMSIRPIRK